MGQISLGYMTKQIFDKHKTRERVNAGQSMTQDDLIQLHDIAYFDQKHKKGSWHLHTNLALSIHSWALQHWRMCFFFNMLVKSMGFKSYSP
jgi:hypothetical protein